MRKLRLFTVAAVACMLALVGTTAWAGGTAPGNNGTIKIDGKPWDNDPNNEPHVGCGFQLDFYGFDVPAHAVATLALQPPSGTAMLFGPGAAIFGAKERDLKPNDVPGGSLDGFDGSIGFQRGEVQTALVNSGGTAHPIQGWHVKLTVTVTSSLGNDTKSKVFWIQDCGPYSNAS